MTNDFNYTGSDMRKIALNDFFSFFLKENAAVYYRADFTGDSEMSKYCSYVEQVKKDTRKISKRLFFDAKINSFYDKNYLMDKDRFEYLYSLYDSQDTSIYYVIFTPKNTVVFNISELWNQKKIKFEPSKKIPGSFVCVLRAYQATEIGFIAGSQKSSTTNPSKTHLHNPQPKREAFPEDDIVAPQTIYNQSTTSTGTKRHFFSEEDDALPLATSNGGITTFDITPAQAAEDKKLGIKRDGSGQIIFESAAQFKLLPEHIQEEFRDRNTIFINIKDKTERERLLKQHGSIKALAAHIKNNLRNNMFNRK